MLDLVPHRLSCYRIADRLDKFSGIPSNVGQLQKELIRRVDFVLATSRSLWEWALSVREDEVYYLPNGVSGIFFEDRKALPDDFPADGKPVAVYAGSIDTRFDLDLLTYAVQKLKDIHFLIIGPLNSKELKTGLQKLQLEDNFTWLGPRDYLKLPVYLQGSAVGLIPFKRSELTEAVNPIKYYEYLASGLPVVAPPLRELKEMGGPLHSYSYEERDQFLAVIRKTLGKVKQGPEKSCNNRHLDLEADLKAVLGKDLIKFAARHTWERRFEEVMGIIEKLNSEVPGI